MTEAGGTTGPGETCAAYGVRYDVWKEHDGLAKRSIFVIDLDGTIRYRWVTDDALETPVFEHALESMTSLAGPDPGR